MNDIAASFAEGFVGAFRLAAAIVSGVFFGTFKLVLRIDRQFSKHDSAWRKQTY